SIAVGASSTVYTADRWYLFTGANQASTVAAVTGLVTGSRLAAKVQRNNGQTGVATNPIFGYPLDSDEIAILLGQVLTLSFTAKAGANWSPSGGTVTVQMQVGTGAPAKVSVGYTNGANIINSTAALTTTPTRFVFTSSSVPTNSTQADVFFIWTPVGTA